MFTTIHSCPVICQLIEEWCRATSVADQGFPNSRVRQPQRLGATIRQFFSEKLHENKENCTEGRGSASKI